MKQAVLILLVVFVSTTFAFPKYLRRPQPTPPSSNSPPPSFSPPPPSQGEKEMACGRVLDRCENPEKRFGGGMDQMGEADDWMMCTELLLEEDFSERKRGQSQAESEQEEMCEFILFDCLFPSSEDLVRDMTGGNGEGVDCKDVLELGQEMGDSDSDSNDDDYDSDKSGNDMALRKLKQLLRKIYRKK